MRSNDNCFCFVISEECNKRQSIETPNKSVIVMPEGYEMDLKKVIRINKELYEVTFCLKRVEDEKRSIYAFIYPTIVKLEMKIIKIRGKIVRNVQFISTDTPKVFFVGKVNDEYRVHNACYFQYENKRVYNPTQIVVEI